MLHLITQSNGCMEHFHGTLVPMLRKAIEANWIGQIRSNSACMLFINVRYT